MLSASALERAVLKPIITAIMLSAAVVVPASAENEAKEVDGIPDYPNRIGLAETLKVSWIDIFGN
jgi:hypothetical protein